MDVLTVYWLLYVASLALLTSAEMLGTQRLRFRIKKRTFRKHGDFNGEVGVVPEARLFTQRMDHFRPADTRTWEQRYWVRDDFFKKGGPVFLFIGGEGPYFDPSSMSSNMTWEALARQHSALMLGLEHRYYGPDSALNTGHHTRGLKYLSSEQALADLAYFIMQMNKVHGELDKDTKWVAFGGSYPGNLAAWLRYKYPHLVYAAVASSAPIKAQLDFPEYMDTVKTDLRMYNKNCFRHFQDVLSQVDKLLKNTRGRLYLQEIFRLCSPPEANTILERAAFYDEIANPMIGCAQSGECGEVCQSMVNSTKANVLQKYAFGLFRSAKLPEKYCLDVSHNSPQTEYEESENRSWMDAWTYQTCTEFGYFQTSEKKGALLGNRIPLNFFVDQCAEFGPRFTKTFIQDAIDWTNNNYGGLNIKVTRVIFVHGTADPWHRLGLNKATNPDSPVIMIEGTTHCADMDHATKPPQLVAAQERIATILGQWLGQSYPVA